MKKFILLVTSVIITISLMSCELPGASVKNKIHEEYLKRVSVAEEYSKLIEENINDFISMEKAFSEQFDGVVIHTGSSVRLSKKITGEYRFSVNGLEGSVKCYGSRVISVDWLPENFNAIVVSDGEGEIIVAVKHLTE